MRQAIKRHIMLDHSTIVLFADISGSVALYENLGDNTAKAIIVKLQEKLGHIVAESGGVVHEVIGDEIMCRFKQPEQAVDCAAKIHHCAADYASESTTIPDTLQMRVGIHSGFAILDRDRLFGDTVNTAARLMAVAQAGQTITTESVLRQLPIALQKTAREFDKTTLKGKSEPIVVYDFPWQAHGLTQINDVQVSSASVTLQLTYARNIFMITAKDCPASLGRAINNLIVIDCEPVSRRHIAIEYMRSRFVLTDKSTNGTHVYPDNGEEIYLRREQMPVWGSGQLSLGTPQNEALDHLVGYKTIRQ